MVDSPSIRCCRITPSHWRHSQGAGRAATYLLTSNLGRACLLCLLVCRQVNEGVVLAVGPGRRNKEGDIIPPSVKEGDKVLLPEYGGSLIKLDNKE